MEIANKLSQQIKIFKIVRGEQALDVWEGVHVRKFGKSELDFARISQGRNLEVFQKFGQQWPRQGQPFF